MKLPRYEIFNGGGNWIPLLIFVIVMCTLVITALLVTK